MLGPPLAEVARGKSEAVNDLESHFPPLSQAADKASLKGQNSFIRLTAARLILLVLGSVLGLLSWVVKSYDIPSVLAGLAFVLALVVEVTLLRIRPDRAWYDGRAAAESLKTLSWKFSVAGNPFSRGLAEDESEELFLSRVREVLDALRGISLPVGEAQPQISSQMRQLRRSDLQQRKQTYLEGRVMEQQDWYATKARHNETRAKQWIGTLVGLELLAAALAFANGLDLAPQSLAGLVGTLIASGAAWLQTRQHQFLASAYSVASQELGIIQSQVGWPTDEESWATFVDQAEEAISREHTTWKASRTTL